MGPLVNLIIRRGFVLKGQVGFAKLFFALAVRRTRETGETRETREVRETGDTGEVRETRSTKKE